MRRLLRHRLLAGAGALLLAGGAGGAYAATQSGSDPQQGLLNDVAKRLHVSPGRLRAAIQGAFLDRLQADVKSGRLTEAQANRIKRRIEQGRVPFPFPLPFGPGGLERRGFEVRPFAFAPPPIAGAAHYLGLTVPQLLRDMQGGKTLADVARSRGRSVTGLKRTMVASERARLDRLVAAGWITKAQARRRLGALTAQIGNVVNGKPPHIAGPIPPIGAPPGGRGWGPAAAPGPGQPPGSGTTPGQGTAPGQGPVPGQGPGPFGMPPGA